MSTPTELDAIGLRCPLPVLRLQRALRGAAPGSQWVLLADDPMAQIDVPHFCAESGHQLVDQQPQGEAMRFTITCGSCHTADTDG